MVLVVFFLGCTGGNLRSREDVGGMTVFCFGGFAGAVVVVVMGPSVTKAVGRLGNMGSVRTPPFPTCR